MQHLRPHDWLISTIDHFLLLAYNIVSDKKIAISSQQTSRMVIWLSILSISVIHGPLDSWADALVISLNLYGSYNYAWDFVNSP